MFALRGASVFDGERVLDRPTVLVDGDAVVAAGVAVPESVPVVDLGAATLLPGLIDCHQHLCFNGNGTLEEQVAGTRRSRGHSVMNGPGQLGGTITIRARTAEANDRAVPGHWESDLLMGKAGTPWPRSWNPRPGS